MTWKECKPQILSDLCALISPEVVNELVSKIAFRINMLTPHSKKLVSNPKILWETERFYPIAENCFYQVFRPLLDVLQSGRPFVPNDLRPFGSGIMSKFEDGLFVDFLLDAICVLQGWRNNCAEEEYLHGDLAYPRLLKALNNRYILHESLSFEHSRAGVERPTDIIKASKVDHTQLKYFYGQDYTQPFPMQRYAKATDECRFTFPSVARLFDNCSSQDELWRNFYVRELYWGTNLAALLSQYANDFSPAGLEGIYSQIWSHCTSEESSVPNPIKQLMNIPTPAYRLSFVNGILKHAVSSDEPFRDMENGWLAALYLYDPKQQVIVTNGLLKKESEYQGFGTKAYSYHSYRALALLIAAWNSIGSNEPKLYTETELKSFFNNFLENDESISRLIDYLCYSVKKSLEEIFGLPVSDDLSKVKERWPLLLIPEHDTAHIHRLMETRDFQKNPRDKHTKAFAAIQSLCYHNHL